MKSVFSKLMVTILGLSLAACAPSASQLKKVMEDNPDVLFSVIKKHPGQFLQVVQDAGRAAEAEQEQKFREEENKRREEEFANPKKPEIAADRAFKGGKDAPVTIVEYSDYQCPFCRRGHLTIVRVLQEYGDKVKVVFKNKPMEGMHEHAMIASQYYEAAALQDIAKANKLHDMIFEDQAEYSEKGEAYLKTAAKKVGLDMARLAKDINSETVKSRIAADVAEAEKFEFNGTPGYLINGVSLKGAYPFEDFKAIIDRHLAKK